MTLQPRDKKALMALGGALVIFAIVWLATRDTAQAKVVAPANPIPFAEKRLAKLRQLAAAVPRKEDEYKHIAAELARREKGLIEAETVAQAQAQLLQIVRKVAKAQSPPLEFHAIEIGHTQPLGNNYGEVNVSVSLDCRVEQLVNFIADLSAQPEIIATNQFQLGSAHPKAKVMPARLTISGIVPRRLIPEKKGLASF